MTAVLGVDGAASFVDCRGKARRGGLAAAVHLVSRQATEVGHPVKFIGQLLDLVEVVGHSYRGLHGEGDELPGGGQTLQLRRTIGLYCAGIRSHGAVN